MFEIDAIAHRRDAIYPATVVGKPRQEDFYIGDFLQELLSPLFPLVMPAVERLWSYGETGYHSLAAAVVKQRYRREAMSSAFRILGEGQLSLTKFLLVTDRPVDLLDFRATLEHVLERTHPETDLYVFSNLSMDTLDYTGPKVNEGSKGVWLGLGDPVRNLPREFRGGPALPSDIFDPRVFCGGCLVVGGPPYAADPGAAKRIAAHPAFEGWPLVVLSDEPRRATASPDQLPVDDVHALRARGGHPRRFGGPRAQPRRAAPADRHRRAPQARLPRRALLRRGHLADGQPPLEGILRPPRRDGRFRRRPPRPRLTSNPPDRPKKSARKRT